MPGGAGGLGGGGPACRRRRRAACDVRPASQYMRPRRPSWSCAAAWTLMRPRDSCEAVVRAPPGKWAVFAFLCGDGLEWWRHLDGDEERGAPQTRHLIGRRQSDERREKSRMRRRPTDGAQRGAGGAGPEPWRGRGAAGRGAGAVARNHVGRGSEGGGAARAAARASARVARAGREREGRARAGRGGGRAQRRGAPALELGGGRGSWPLERLQPNLEEPPRSQRRARDEKVNFFSPDFFSLSVSCCAACSPARVTRTRGRGHPTVLN